MQESLTKEVVIWKHGVLVLPPIIHDTVRCMQVRTRALLVRWISFWLASCMLEAERLNHLGRHSCE